MNKLIKIKICIETEAVGENVREDTDIEKVGNEIFRINRDEIIAQAYESGEYSITTEPLDKITQLPKGWNGNCNPWRSLPFCVNPEQKIKEFFKNKKVKSDI